MNLNYVGSLAQARMRFRSTTDVIVHNINELFNAQSIYIPKRFAAQNIIGWDDTLVTPETPAVFVAVVDNYAKIMTGNLLAQWQPIFRQDTNGAVIMYLIVFDDGVTDGWEMQERMITYEPLTTAFNALFPFSYFKYMFDPHFDGRDVTIPVSPGAPAEMRIRLINQTRGGTFARQDVVFTNPLSGAITPATQGSFDVVLDNNTGNPIGVSADTYSIPGGGGITYQAVVAAPISVVDNTSFTLNFVANNAGADPQFGLVTSASTIQDWLQGSLTFSAFTLDVIQNVVPGTNAISGGSLILYPGTYTYNDGSKIWNIMVNEEYVLSPNGGNVVFPNVRPLTVGEAPGLVEGMNITGLFYGTLPPAGMLVTSTNIIDGTNPGTGEEITIAQGAYQYFDGVTTFIIDMPTALTMRPDDVSSQVRIHATINGVAPNLGQGTIEGNILDPRMFPVPFPSGIAVLLLGTTQGIEPITTPLQAPSQFFDMSLALAYLCKTNISLSLMWSLVKISYEDKMPNMQDRCWIRFAKRAEQLENMTDIAIGNRARYYWAALYLMECQNTCVLVHSEPQYIIADILAAWFGARNSSGTYIGNKLSLLRLSGTRIKPLGWPSWLDSSINENDADGHQQLRDMNVGHLATIADNTPQESYLTMARCVGDIDKGLPVSMLMISKFVDYTCAQEAAKMITNTGTLTDPVMADEAAYGDIQRLVRTQLGRFSGTNGRLTSVTLVFPDFAQARKSRTALSAASSWRATYKDDLDEIEVSGGIVAE